jgi:capsular polysaccharide biosynthesis protein
VWQEVKVELQDYLNILRKRGWIIILTACITAASALGFSLVQTPKYRATAKLSVNPARADWGLVGAAKNLLRNYTMNMTTHKTAQKVIDRAELDMSTDDLLSKVTVSSDESNFTLQVDVKDYDPVVAIQIAQTLAEVFIEDQTEWNQKQDKRDRIEVSLLDDVRDAPLFSPKKKINTLAGGIFGVLLGGVIVLFLEWLESDILRTSGDVERFIGLTVLGAIPAPGGSSPGASRRKSRGLRLGRLTNALVVFAAGFLVGGVAVGLAFTLLQV